MTRVLSVIMPSPAVGSWLRLVVDAQNRDQLLSDSSAAPFEVVRGAAACPV
jgi:hypothetical protein